MSVKQKVAILKSRLYRGGVAQVLGFMISDLNKKGIIPDILVLRSDLTPSDFKRLYNLEIEFKIRIIGPDLKMPYEWHFLYFNLLTRGYAAKYDLFINSNNTSFLSSRKIKTITYDHFPRKFRVISANNSIHFPEKMDKHFFDIKYDPFYLARLIYRFNKSYGNNEVLIANSNFTAQKMRESYFSVSDVEILYPPVPISAVNLNEKKAQVVSLGRISDEKRQLEQLEIASFLPEVPFYILGFSNTDEYFRKCEKVIYEKKLSNVFLLPNLPLDEINRILSESLIFLHNVRNEPFGIGIVQAATNNCIPVIHGSGGATEIITNKELYFTTVEEATSIIKKIKKGEIKFTFSNKFSPENFSKQFNEVLDSIQ